MASPAGGSVRLDRWGMREQGKARGAVDDSASVTVVAAVAPLRLPRRPWERGMRERNGKQGDQRQGSTFDRWKVAVRLRWSPPVSLGCDTKWEGDMTPREQLSQVAKTSA
ncbi:hypothetical protein MTO96_049436 [Rhipicephalus appendiculatus]